MKSSKLFTKLLAVGILAGFIAIGSASAADDIDTKPVPVKTPPPSYPNSMRRDGVQGLVALKITIDESGAVTECAVNKSSHPDFEQPAIEAVKKWKFKPASKAGVAVKTNVVIPIKFTLET